MRVPATGAKWIEVKRSIYLPHPACETVLMIEQDRMEVRADVRTAAGWTAQTLGAADELHLPGFGLRCIVAQSAADLKMLEPPIVLPIMSRGYGSRIAFD